MIGGGGDAADDDFRNAGLVVVEHNAGQADDIVGQAVGVGLGQLFTGDGADRHGDLADILLALAGGDDDVHAVIVGGGLLRHGGACAQRNGDRRYAGIFDKIVNFHNITPYFG